MDKSILSKKRGVFAVVIIVTVLLLLTWAYLAGFIPFQIEENLLIGTNHGAGNFRLMDKGFDASVEKAGTGIKITSMARDPNGWLVLFFDDGHSRNLLSGPEGVPFTLSFEAKANTAGAEIRASHRQGDAQQNQIDFGIANISSVNTWEAFSLTGTLIGTPATTQGVYLNLKENTPGTEITIRNLKLVKSE